MLKRVLVILVVVVVFLLGVVVGSLFGPHVFVAGSGAPSSIPATPTPQEYPYWNSDYNGGGGCSMPFQPNKHKEPNELASFC